MDDLRESNSVKKQKRFNLFNWIIINYKNIKSLFMLSIIIMIIFFPHVVGYYIGLWVNNMISSFFSGGVSLTYEQWGAFLITSIVFVFVRWLYRKTV